MVTAPALPESVFLRTGLYVFPDFQMESNDVVPHVIQRRYYKFTDFPIKKESMVVPDPRDIVTKALPSIPSLRTSMQTTILDMKLAVEDMAQAKQLGQQEEKKDEEEKARRKKILILLIISVVLMFVPVVGEEFAATAGLTSLARAIALTGELGNGVMTGYDTVEDPGSAVLKILGMLLEVGSNSKASRDAPGIGSIAKIRNAMKAEDIASLGNIFIANDDKLQSIMKVCRRS